jgi:hypothetical protein
MWPDNKLVFYLLPLGEVPGWTLGYIGRLVIENFGAFVARLEGQPLPPKAYLPEKDAYDANDLLDDMKLDVHTKNRNIIEITAAELYDPTGGGTYLDGMAFLGGPAILISLPGDADKSSNEARIAIRNILLHELGHFFGLTDRGCGQTILWKIKHFLGLADRGQCLMNDKARSTTANLNYCAACQKKIKRALARKAWQP